MGIRKRFRRCANGRNWAASFNSAIECAAPVPRRSGQTKVNSSPWEPTLSVRNGRISAIAGQSAQSKHSPSWERIWDTYGGASCGDDEKAISGERAQEQFRRRERKLVALARRPRLQGR